MKNALQLLKSKKAGLFVLIILLLGFGMYFLAIKNNKKEFSQAPVAQENTDSNKTGENPAQTGEEKRTREDVADKQDGQNAILQDNEIAGWETYKDTKYGFEIRYPKDILSLADSSEHAYGIFLKSYDVTNTEDSDVQSMQIIVERIKDSAYNDAKNRVAEAGASAMVMGPETKQVNGKEVFVTTYKLYDGGEGVDRSYYFPSFVLTFGYANNEMEGKFLEIEKKMLPTLRFAEK